MSPRLLSPLALFLFVSCLVGPDYEVPEIAVPETWSAQPQGAPLTPQELAEWWRRFDDPVLDELVLRAREGNVGLRKALARIEEVRARRGIAKADWFPDLDLSAGATRSRTSRSGSNSNVSGFQFDARTLYDAGFEIAWELDLFGRVRRSVQAAQADIEAAAWDMRDALVLLQAEVATSYVDLRTAQRRLEIVRSNLELQQSGASIADARFEAGLAPAADASQARAVVLQTRATIPALGATMEAAKNRLCTLLGETPGTLDSLLAESSKMPRAARALTAGIPADVVRQRPDVRRAERELAAQSARIGVAAADLYPSLELRGSFTWESSETSNLFEANSEAFRLGPKLRWNLLEFGKIRNRVRAEDARAKGSLADYEETVLRALEEVETTLVRHAGERSRESDVKAARAEAQRALELVQTLYEEGDADYQNLIAAQTTLAGLDELTVDNESRLALDAITLFRALGGGWQDPAEESQ